MANPVGRPPKLNETERREVYEALEQYIRTEEDPTIAGFISYNEVALKHKVYEHNMQDWTEFSNLIKSSIRKQEAYLLTKGGSGKYNPTIAIFRLKQPQHGYTDRSQVDNTVHLPKPLMDLTDVLPDNSNTED